MIKALRTFTVRPSLPAPLQPLSELAMNLRWAWDLRTQELFRWADPDVYDEVRGNPVALLGRLSPDRLATLAADVTFLSELTDVHDELRRYVTQARWAQGLPNSGPRVAYFSPEFGLTEAMQTYSGGLGVLAGDHLKAASDLGVDLVGVGLLYRHGYFRQQLDANGWQQESYPDLNPYSLPLRLLDRDGGPATVQVTLGERAVACQIWKAQVGRVPLLLLDTDVPSNAPEDRSVTDKLYGGDVEHRLCQEIVLGIGGRRALDLAAQLGEVNDPGAEGVWQAEVFHSNEGHAGFLNLERIRRRVRDEGLSFDEAIESTRAGSLFTTHTPVPAGIDVFPRDLMDRYFGAFAAECGVDMDTLMSLGQAEGSHPGAAFNMAVMGLRLSGKANGVSQLHGAVSREMFDYLWPGVGTEDVPITSVTNGVHSETWVGPEMMAVYNRHLARDWPYNPRAWRRVPEIGDDMLWRARARARERMVTGLRAAVRAQNERRGVSPGSLAWTDEIFDPEALTIGFARRFAEYKRGTLLLRQPDRLQAMLTSIDRPVQFVFAGKAHPRDEIGKDIIRQLVHFSSDPQLRTRIVFVEDYDMALAGMLYQGVDVWLNNPRRPHEACGTSGQKAALNGALHASTLDGWWDEMYDGRNGFSIGSPTAHDDVHQQDAADAQALFDLLENTLVPLFYDRAEGPLPRRWISRIRQSIATLGPRVLGARMVREYVEDLYIPLARRHRRLNTDKHRRARDLAAWRGHLNRCWDQVRVRRVDGDQQAAAIGEHRDIAVTVELGALSPDDVVVELLHGGVRADGTLKEPATMILALAGPDDGAFTYTGNFECGVSGEYGLAVRVVPCNEDLISWTETGLSAWATDAQG